MEIKPDSSKNLQNGGRPISQGTRIGHVHLKVANIERALGFYCGVLGFLTKTGDESESEYPTVKSSCSLNISHLHMHVADARALANWSATVLEIFRGVWFYFHSGRTLGLVLSLRVSMIVWLTDLYEPIPPE